MMIHDRPSPFAGVVPFRSNGSSVPSIGGTVTLAAALSRVAAAEEALSAARAHARAAAKREGVSVRGLFEDSRYILRATGEKWCDEARAEGDSAGYQRACKHLERAFDPSIDHEFKHITARLVRLSHHVFE
jgi:hypothetical protein